jgi:hypothetical protein
MANDKIVRFIYPVGLCLCYFSIIGFPIGSALLLLLKPCLSIFLSSIVFPCNTKGAVHIFSDLNQLATALILAALEAGFMSQIIICGCIVNAQAMHFEMVMRTYFIEALSDVQKGYGW